MTKARCCPQTEACPRLERCLQLHASLWHIKWVCQAAKAEMVSPYQYLCAVVAQARRSTVINTPLGAFFGSASAETRCCGKQGDDKPSVLFRCLALWPQASSISAVICR